MSTSLQIDPRIQQLIEATFVRGGTVVFMSPVPDSLTGWIEQGTVLQQDHTPQFWTQMVNSALV